MGTHLIRPTSVRPLDVRCSVGDVIVANLAVHIVFFFEKRLETTTLVGSLARALTSVPIFAGRLRWAVRGMRIHCTGQGVPFSEVSAGATMSEAVRSVATDTGLWLVDPVNAVTARWGWGPLCTVRVTHLAGDATAIGISWHHSVGDLQTMMYLVNAWAAAADGESIPEPLIVEDRVAHLAEHLPADTARHPGVRCLGIVRVHPQRLVSGYGRPRAANPEPVLRRRRDRPHERRVRTADPPVRERHRLRSCR